MAKLTQEQLLEIFNAVKKEMKPYEKGNVKARIDIQGRYELWSEKPGINVLGKIRTEMAFVALILQSNYVGFYYTPLYCNTQDVRSKIPGDLLKNLKGKSCFHLTAIDKETLKNIKEAMKVAYAEFKHNSWL